MSKPNLKKVSQMSTSTQYPFTNSARHPIPNSIFFMLMSKVSAPNQKLFPMPANQDLALHASLCVDHVIQTVVRHYAKVKPANLKTHCLPVIPQIAITAKNASISEYVTQYNQITSACLNFLNAKIASYFATR
jgi:hypothetical protein